MLFVLPRIASQSQKHHTSYRLTDGIVVLIYFLPWLYRYGYRYRTPYGYISYIYVYISILIIFSPGYGSNGHRCFSSPARPGRSPETAGVPNGGGCRHGGREVLKKPRFYIVLWWFMAVNWGIVDHMYPYVYIMIFPVLGWSWFIITYWDLSWFITIHSWTADFSQFSWLLGCAYRLARAAWLYRGYLWLQPVHLMYIWYICA